MKTNFRRLYIELSDAVMALPHCDNKFDVFWRG